MQALTGSCFMDYAGPFTEIKFHKVRPTIARRLAEDGGAASSRGGPSGYLLLALISPPTLTSQRFAAKAALQCRPRSRCLVVLRPPLCKLSETAVQCAPTFCFATSARESLRKLTVNEEMTSQW